MITGHDNLTKRLPFIILLVLLLVFQACRHAGDGDIVEDNDLATMEFFFYPNNEVIFHDTFALFCTTVYLVSPQGGVDAAAVTIGYDQGVMEYESVFSRDFIVSANDTPGALQVQVSALGAYDPVDYLEVCSVTWKATATAITDMSLTIEGMTNPDGLPVEYRSGFSNTVKILKVLGSISIEGAGAVLKGTHFSNTLYFGTEDKILADYDITVTYDPRKITIDESAGESGIMLGRDGFIDEITHDYGTITIRGTNTVGTGAGSRLEFFSMRWYAEDSGSTAISVRVNRIMTGDAVFIKPSIQGKSISIQRTGNKPLVEIRFAPETLIVNEEDLFDTGIILDTKDYKIAAYGINVYYDPDVLQVDADKGNNGVSAGADGFLAAANPSVPGEIRIAGFDVGGKGPDPDMELLVIHWKAIGVDDASTIFMNIKSLTDQYQTELLHDDPGTCTVTVNESVD
ncbi:MAG: hypothetical protein JW881_20700 [Spirochaetales bacterium]|nr:hypothetical protein [Spirochaetales bacterium]